MTIGLNTPSSRLTDSWERREEMLIAIFVFVLINIFCSVIIFGAVVSVLQEMEEENRLRKEVLKKIEEHNHESTD